MKYNLDEFYLAGHDEVLKKDVRLVRLVMLDLCVCVCVCVCVFIRS